MSDAAMIERVAKAIWDAGFDRMPEPWDKQTHLQREFHRMLAREAIRAMRAEAITEDEP